MPLLDEDDDCIICEETGPPSKKSPSKKKERPPPPKSNLRSFNVISREPLGDCLFRTTVDMAVAILPFQMMNGAIDAVKQQFQSLFYLFVPELDGILHEIERLRIISQGRRNVVVPLVAARAHQMHALIDVRITCKVFHPSQDAYLTCLVTAVLPDMLSCISHDAYSVTVSHFKKRSKQITEGNDIKVKITQVRSHQKHQMSINAVLAD